MTRKQTIASKCWQCDTPDDNGNPEYHYCENCRRAMQRRLWLRVAEAFRKDLPRVH